MKAIELTIEHKSKLLEMCNKLFPGSKLMFGDFYSSEVGADYVGLDYLDVTHINHKIPCVKSGFELNPPKEDRYAKYEDGFLHNVENNQYGFTKEGNIVKQQSNYNEQYVEGIHWFEFCMTQLPYKLMTLLDNQLEEDDTHDAKHMNIVIVSRNWVGEMYLQIMDSWSNKIHPIDYLYEKFKELKL